MERRPGAQAKRWGLDLVSTDDPPINEKSPQVFGWSVLPKDFGDFYIQIFDLWIRKDIGRIHVQKLEAAHNKKAGTPTVSAFTQRRAATPSPLNIEVICIHAATSFIHNTISETPKRPLSELVDSPRQREFGLNKRDGLHQY